MNFAEHIKGETPVLVDFTAAWCGPCKTMQPVLAELKARRGDGLKILKIDIDKNPSVAQHFNIQGVPTFLLFKKGDLLWRQSGAMPLHVLDQQIGKFV